MAIHSLDIIKLVIIIANDLCQLNIDQLILIIIVITVHMFSSISQISCILITLIVSFYLFLCVSLFFYSSIPSLLFYLISLYLSDSLFVYFSVSHYIFICPVLILIPSPSLNSPCLSLSSLSPLEIDVNMRDIFSFSHNFFTNHSVSHYDSLSLLYPIIL